ncbi:hypothetical protein E2C01_089270 [Portunus trituberculatus]|uniref:Uncharacterized protein n=1 Tax=Portunus trituberculatus TaxID=210409 RepID=A0A5B7JLZ5_PORTR|nr:hypothetical protein [Portunus trituberculatus]
MPHKCLVCEVKAQRVSTVLMWIMVFFSAASLLACLVPARLLLAEYNIMLLQINVTDYNADNEMGSAQLGPVASPS